MPGRNYTATTTSGYRFGFNGQEKSNEIFEGSTTALFWEYDSRTGRRWNVDPKGKIWESTYSCFGGSPLANIDPLGNDWIGVLSSDGKSYQPVWRKDVTSKTKLGKNEHYITRDGIISCTDGKSYRLAYNGRAYSVSDEKKKSLLNNGLKVVEMPTPAKGNNEKPGNNNNAESETESNQVDNNNEKEEKETEGYPIGFGFGLVSPEFITYNYTGNINVFGELTKNAANNNASSFPMYGNFTVTNDKYGNLYFTPFNLTIPFNFNANAAVTTWHLYKPAVLNEKELRDFICGVSFEAAGTWNYVSCAIQTDEKGSIWAVGLGLAAPKKDGSVSIGFQPEFMVIGGGKKWNK